MPLSTSEEDELELKLRDFEKSLNLSAETGGSQNIDEIYDVIDSELQTRNEENNIDFRTDFLSTFVKNLIRHSYRPSPESEKKEIIMKLTPRSIFEPVRRYKVKNPDYEQKEELVEENKSAEIEKQEEKEIEKEEATKKPSTMPRVRRMPIKRLPGRVGPLMQRPPLQRVPIRPPPQRRIPLQNPLMSRQMPQQGAQSQQGGPNGQQFNRQNQPLPPAAPQLPIPISNLPMEAQTPDVSGVIGMLNLGRVSQLLQDPGVFSVECPGPGKYILVNKAGRVQTTTIALTTEEINEIMGDISDKTRIPLLGGLFKAILGNVLVTAIVSDYIGTRFVFQKRLPFKK